MRYLVILGAAAGALSTASCSEHELASMSIALECMNLYPDDYMARQQCTTAGVNQMNFMRQAQRERECDDMARALDNRLDNYNRAADDWDDGYRAIRTRQSERTNQFNACMNRGETPHGCARLTNIEPALSTDLASARTLYERLNSSVNAYDRAADEFRNACVYTGIYEFDEGGSHRDGRDAAGRAVDLLQSDLTGLRAFLGGGS